MFTRNFKKFLRREGKSFRRKFSSGKKGSKPNFESLKKFDKIIYYNYRRSGHIQPECPELQKIKEGKKKAQKPKAMICTWSDEEEDDDENTSSEEEDKKLCLMAIGDEDENNQVTSLFEDYFNSDWEEAYSEILDKYEHVKRDNRHLKKKINSLVHDTTLSDKNVFKKLKLMN